MLKLLLHLSLSLSCFPWGISCVLIQVQIIVVPLVGHLSQINPAVALPMLRKLLLALQMEIDPSSPLASHHAAHVSRRHHLPRHHSNPHPHHTVHTARTPRLSHSTLRPLAVAAASTHTLRTTQAANAAAAGVPASFPRAYERHRQEGAARLLRLLARSCPRLLCTYALPILTSLLAKLRASAHAPTTAELLLTLGELLTVTPRSLEPQVGSAGVGASRLAYQCYERICLSCGLLALCLRAVPFAGTVPFARSLSSC